MWRVLQTQERIVFILILLFGEWRALVGSFAGEFPFDSPPGVYISELMADNKRTLRDEDGDSSDWIELFNANSTAASLDGWCLTDDKKIPTKWRFPNVSLPPHGYLVVFASAKDKKDSTSQLHTNFKLSTEGEYLALLSDTTNVVSEFSPTYPKQFTDVSFGRAQGSPKTAGYFTRPTPGEPNSTTGIGFASEVTFSRPSGTFLSEFNLVLSTASTNALIRYTLDGSFPTNSSPTFVAPIRVTNSVQVRARAFQEGLFPGPPITETFLLLSNDVAKFKSDLPVIVIHSLGQGPPNVNVQHTAYFSVHEPINGLTSLTNMPTLTTRAGVKVRKAELPKSTFTIEFWNEFDEDKHEEVLGLPPESDWVLYAPKVEDSVLIHNPFIHQLSREMGRYSSRTRFVELYLNTGRGPIGATDYNGIYVLEEKIKIGKNRVAVDKLQPEQSKLPEVSGSYLLEIDFPDRDETGIFFYEPSYLIYVDPPEHEIKLPQRAPQDLYIRSYLADFVAALNGTNWFNPNLGYAKYIDTDSWIDWHILESLSGNVDSMGKSSYFYKPRNGKIMFGPHWDFDLALGGLGGSSGSRNWSMAGSKMFSGWWQPLLRDPDFWQRWIDRYQELRRKQLSLDNMDRLVDQLSAQVRQAQPREQARWNPRLRGLTYEEEVAFMKTWLSNKVDFVDGQLVQPPALSSSGGKIPSGFALGITGPTNSTVYFTLDGTDPRLSQGKLSSQAHAYTRPITLNSDAQVVARAINLNQRQTGGPPISSPWSGPTFATFTVAPSQAPPRFEILGLSVEPGPLRTLSFFSLPGQSYTIQFRDDLAQGSWQILTNVVAPSDGGVIRVTDLSVGQIRFYRWMTP